MRKMAIGVLVMVCMQAQTVRNFLLPQNRHILGQVIDSEGEPVAEASIDHTNDRRRVYQTDSEGRFELTTNAPALVVRKTGYRSEMVRTSEAAEVRVTLQKLTGSLSFLICAKDGKYDGIDGWGATFQFARISAIKVNRQGQDVDYGARSYYVDTKHGRKGIMHGCGAMWSFGMPLDQDVWQSVNYEEASYKAGARTIIDARGQLPNGNRWRSIGTFGESAAYSDVDAATVKILDQFLDGACLKATSP